MLRSLAGRTDCWCSGRGIPLGKEVNHVNVMWYYQNTTSQGGSSVMEETGQCQDWQFRLTFLGIYSQSESWKAWSDIIYYYLPGVTPSGKSGCDDPPACLEWLHPASQAWESANILQNLLVRPKKETVSLRPWTTNYGLSCFVLFIQSFLDVFKLNLLGGQFQPHSIHLTGQK